MRARVPGWIFLQALAYIWNGPHELPRSVAIEWRLVPLRWLGIALMLPSLLLLGLPPERLAFGYALLVGAAIFNIVVQRTLPRRPYLFTSGYITAVGDALLTVAMLTIGGGFDTPLYFVLFTVTTASAMRFGYGPAAAAAVTVISVDLASHADFGVRAIGSSLIRSGFLVLTGLLASYLREQARRAEAALQTQLEIAQHAAVHDSLTGLPNRVLLKERLEEALQEQTRPVALMFLDLDQLKAINDTYGHRYGDMLLQEVACRLEAAVPEHATVARLAGDEFAVLLPQCGVVSACAMAGRLLDAIAQPLALDEIAVALTARMGIAMAPEHGTDAGLLSRRADVAMYAAKDARADYVVFSPEHDIQTRERLELSTDLKGAVERDELSLVYHPVVSLQTGRVVELEALVRWQHPSRGPIPPSVFVPLAEETGSIHAIGRWILDEACAQAAAWRSQIPAADSLVINVNVSARQFQQASVVSDVQDVLERTGLDPGALKIEITETVAMEDPELSIASLWLLKNMGVHLAIDDFGTGYSSLGYLKRFPVDTLKIDKVFVDGLGLHAEDEAIVAATLAFARAVGLSTTAEGVESVEQLRLLTQLGVDRIQGYLCARPLPPEQVPSVLTSPTLLPTPAEMDEAPLACAA